MPIKVIELHHHGIRIGKTEDEVESGRRLYTEVRTQGATVLNGAPARRAATNADAAGLAPLNLAIPQGVRGAVAPGARGNTAAAQEIRAMLQEAAQKK
jgi:hypothetical protein